MVVFRPFNSKIRAQKFQISLEELNLNEPGFNLAGDFFRWSSFIHDE